MSFNTEQRRRPLANSPGTLQSRALVGVALTGLALPLAAQPGDRRIEELVVTAQKREQAPIDVPITMTNFSAGFLSRQGIDDIDRLSDFIPGVRIDEQSVNNPAINVRGITTDDGSAATQPRVSVFQDGVDISRPRGSSIALFDLDRIEVLKGPQSTLLGRGAMVGAINYISAPPENEINGSLALEVGDFDQRKVEGHYNTPLIDDVLLLRVAGSFRSRNGHIDNITGERGSQNPSARADGSNLQGVETFAARGSLTFNPNDRLGSTLILNYQQDDQPGTSFKSTVVPPTGGTTDPFEFAEFDAGKELGIDRELWSATLDIDYELNDRFSLTSISSFRTFDAVELFDADGFQARFLEFIEDATSDQFSQELRLNFDDGERISGSLGFNAFYEDGEQRVVFATDERVFANLFTGTFVNPDGSVVLADGFPASPFIEEQTISNETWSTDVFGDASYQLTPRLEVSGGIRFSFSDVESELVVPAISPNRAPTGLNNLVLPLFTVGGAAPGRDKADDTFTGLTGRIAFRYALTEDFNLYAGYSRGRRPDVLDEQDATDTIEKFKEETVDSFEVGAKSTWFNGLLAADFAAFYYDFNNFRTTIDDPESDGLNAITSDAGEAETIGAEVDVRYQVTPEVFMFLTYGYLDSEISDSEEFGPVDTEGFVAGDTFRISPDHSVAVGADMTQSIGYGMSLFLRPSYTWQDEVFFSNDNQSDGGINRQGSFGIFDIRAGVESEDGRWRVAGFIDNVSDEEFLLDSGNTGGGFGLPTQIAGPPRMFGVEISGNF